MKIMVVGLGSMGKRRIRLLQQIFSDATIIGVDSKLSRRQEAERLYGIRTEASLESACEDGCEIAFVCTSPLSHGDIIEQALLHSMHVFTEINLVSDKYDTNIALAKEKGLVLFLSSTFLYRKEIKYIRNEVRQAKSILSYTYHVGQYLPDWHPWENYTDYFVGDTRTNGCREIMAIDFPWLYKTFGCFASIEIKRAKKTKLKTPYPDGYLMLVEHENGVQGTIMVDVISRKAVRNLEIYGEDLYITWDGSVDGLKKYNIHDKVDETVRLYEVVDRREEYASFVVENAYRNEIEAFFKGINEGEKPEYDFEDDYKILRTIEEIENSG